MRAGVEQYQRVHLEAQLDCRACKSAGRIETHRAGVIDRDFAEPVDRCGQIASSHAVFGGFDQKTVVAVLLPVIAMSLIAGFAPARGDSIPGRTTANSIVPACAVLDDRAQHAAHIRVETMTLAQFESVLALQRVGHAIALGQGTRVVEQHPNIGTTVDVGQPQPVAAAHNE